MKQPSVRIRKRHTPQRQLSDSRQVILVPRRRSSCLQSHPSRAISHTNLPTFDPINASALVPSREQLQEYGCPPQTRNSQTQKRSHDEPVETTIERPIGRCLLTKKNLKSFEKMETRARQAPKSKLLQSRHPSPSEPNSSPPQPNSLQSHGSQSSSKTVSTTDSRFPFLAGGNGILWEPNAKPPTNIQFLRDRLNRSRGTASPTELEYEATTHNLVVAENEGTLAGEASDLLKNHYVIGYRRAINLPFKDFPKDVGFNNGLSPARPDLIEGLEMPKFDPFPTSEQLTAAVPYSTRNAITLPHFAGEWKGPGKDLNLARVQVAYDGASMVYARNEARLFLESPDPVGSAHVVTFTSDGTSLHTFANYSSETHGQIEYHQSPITSSFIRSSFEDFKKSRRQLRNLQDYAKESSETLRDNLIKKWSGNQHQPPASTSLPAEAVDVRDNSCDNDDEHDGEDGPNSQYASFNDQDRCDLPHALRPFISDSGCDLIHDLEVLTPTDGYNISHGPQPLRADGGCHPNPSLVQIANSVYHPPEATLHSQVNPPYSPKNTLLALKSLELSFSATTKVNERIDTSSVRCHPMTLRSRGRTEISKVQKRNDHEASCMGVSVCDSRFL